ncbi:MAG: hypothetical protein JJU28_07460 [Cyclobacteriaceae bacterium]|nr:hypothetical protein [Cyclobacteriaceae bacterium]
MQIYFQTKEESKQRQREDFLHLSPEERFMAFLDLSRKINRFPGQKSKVQNNNFIISRKA